MALQVGGALVHEIVQILRLCVDVTGGGRDMSSKRSRVHPKHKTDYRIANWPVYDRALAQRGSLTIWMSPEAIRSWNARPSRRRGGQHRYSDLAIETVLTLRLVFHLPLRQAEGFMTSIFELMDVDLNVPDHTTLSRRGRSLRWRRLPRREVGDIVLAIDSSGLTIHGEGHWAAAKRGTKAIQGWRKLHLAVDGAGTIVAHELTESSRDDATIGSGLVRKVKGDIQTVIADSAYDTRPFYDAASRRGSEVVVPPINRATIGRRRCAPREATIRRVREVGRRAWKKEAGYHRQARAENAVFRYKTILGDRLRARSQAGQKI